MADPQDALPPDAGTQQVADATPQQAPSPPVLQAPEIAQPTEEERQSTREWLRSLGVVAGDVATREQPRMEREQERVAPPQQAQPTRRMSPDTEEVLSLLREGDDARFVEGIVDMTRRRISGEMQKVERDAAFGQKINEYVTNTAPDVPLVVFWALAERAERTFPGEVDKQIDWAIKAGRTAMGAHQALASERGQAIRQNQEQSETLDGTPTRQRRRGAREPEPRTTSFVEELLAARAKYE
jgi:hypothetical protein